MVRATVRGVEEIRVGNGGKYSRARKGCMCETLKIAADKCIRERGRDKWWGRGQKIGG